MLTWLALCVGVPAAAPAAASAVTYDPRIVGVEVTQGVQKVDPHTRPVARDTRRTSSYTGVLALQEGRPAVVKVYATFGESGIVGVPGYSARLTVRESTSSGLRPLGTLVPDIVPVEVPPVPTR